MVLICTFMVVKKVSPVSWGMWGTYNASSELALKGHDPVAYFTIGQPTMGSEQYTHRWGDVT